MQASLSANHRREIITNSSVDEAVALERGYVTVERPNAALRDAYGRDTREQLRALGFPSWAIREDYYFPGLHIPQYTPSGGRYAGQFKPFRAVANREGKPMRYASAKGPARLDVHPRWSILSTEILPPIIDPSRRLWITEGVKKADSLTSRGEVTVALAGVYNWRNTHASLGDWEDVRLRGRDVVLCFDADAISKPAVAQAMARLGKWLKFKGVARVWYLVVPPGVNGGATKGVDDFFAAGGTLKELEQAFATKPPEVTSTEDRFTDARLAETMATEVLDGRYVWSAGLDWLAWDGRRWAEATEVTAMESVRVWALDSFADAAGRLKRDDKGAAAEVEGFKTLLSASRARTVLSLARGVVERRADAFDTDGWISLAGGALNPETREVLAHDPDRLNRRSLPFGYNPDAVAPRWTWFLNTSLPGDPEAHDFLAEWFGYVLTGRTDQQKMASLVGKKRSGKSTVTRVLTALLGTEAVTGTDLGSIASHFGRADLIGKALAVMGDVRWNARNAGEAVPFLLRIIGEDPMTVPRKHRDDWTGRIGARFMMTGNDTPVFSDRSNAMAARMIHVVFPISFEGREDFGLEHDLLAELPGILNWALDGLDRLNKQGRFTVPASGAEEDAAVRRGSNPIGAFAEDWCVFEAGAATRLDDLWTAYTEWCRREGLPGAGRKEIFSKELRGQNALGPARRVGQAKTSWVDGVQLGVVSPPIWGISGPLGGQGDR